MSGRCRKHSRNNCKICGQSSSSSSSYDPATDVATQMLLNQATTYYAATTDTGSSCDTSSSSYDSGSSYSADSGSYC